MTRLPLVLQLVREPAAAAARFTLADWDLALRQAASGMLEASVGALLAERGLLEALPAQAREHLAWAAVHAARHRQATAWEVAQIGRALAPLGIPVILLKGAAYASAGLDAAQGRLFSDIDILVPKEQLGAVESALMVHGWEGSHHDEYDQRYYRDWMHEIPPMQHVRRASLIDVHHAILPPTAAVHPDPALLRAGAVALPGQAPFHVFAPTDMVLHSALHLFYDGELDHGSRDLVDLHRLLRAFGAEAGFWDGLAARAEALELGRPLFYALRYCAMLLGTPVPAAALARSRAGAPNAVLLTFMDQLFARALLPVHASCDRRLTGAARFLLYIRANWLRMPPLMLARHLFHKAFITPRRSEAVKAAKAAQAARAAGQV